MNITEKYAPMLAAFAADLSLATDQTDKIPLTKLQTLIDRKNNNIIKDIELLMELEFSLRHGTVKIIDCEGENDEE